MSRHALTRGSLLRFLAVGAAFIVLTAAATPAEATDHNARVAEYLLFLQQRAAGARNACVAEYLLLQRADR